MESPNRYDRILDKYFGETTLLTDPLNCPKRTKIWQDTLRLVYPRRHPLVCVDVEAHEMAPKKVTEVGISIYDPKDQEDSAFPDITSIHIVISEHLRIHNSRFCPDNKTRFMGGNSYILSRVDSGKFITKLMNKYLIAEKGVLVGHSVEQDLKWIRSLKVPLPQDTKTVDTMSLFNTTRKNQSTLRGILRHLNIPHGYLHNAGNDAYYTLLAAIAYCDPAVRKKHGLDNYMELEKLTPAEKKKEKFSDTAKLTKKSAKEMEDMFGLSEEQ